MEATNIISDEHKKALEERLIKKRLKPAEDVKISNKQKKKVLKRLTQEHKKKPLKRQKRFTKPHSKSPEIWCIPDHFVRVVLGNGRICHRDPVVYGAYATQRAKVAEKYNVQKEVRKWRPRKRTNQIKSLK